MALRLDYVYGSVPTLVPELGAGESAIHPAIARCRGIPRRPFGLRTDLMWDRLDMLAELDEPVVGAEWADRFASTPTARHPGDEEEFDDEEVEDEEDDLDDDFDDEDDDLDDDFDDEDDDLDDDIDDEIDGEIDDIDVEDDEDDDLDDDEDDDLDADEDDDIEDI
jgi:hypothetical protein